MGLLEDCKEYFKASDLYQVLNISKESTDSAIKQAYKKLSLKVHPDRVSSNEKENATKKFQILSKVCRILLDKDLRTMYDSEGIVDDDGFSLNENILKDWSQYWRTMFNLNIEDVHKFEETYRHSDAEIEDLKAVYVECEGDMDQIFENQICSRIEDESRYRTILGEAIDKKEVPSFDIFVNEPKSKQRKRKKFYEREKKEAEEECKRRNIGRIESESDLEKLIISRQENRKKQMDSFLDNLEAKYAKKPKQKNAQKGKKKK